MITSTDALAAAVRKALDAGAVGIDTEFIWERTFYPTLGIVQIGYPDEHCELIDAPAIGDWSPFAELMADAGTVKILHDAQQDLTILKRACGAFPKNIFDTQRASGFVGLSSTVSLSDLLKTVLRVRLAKTETRSNWLARPLTESQEKYAEEDVRYSTKLRDELLARAEKYGRRHWVDEEMALYENEALYRESDPDAEMPRVRGSGSLTGKQRSVLRALGAWREEKARRRNLPRSFVLSDEAIVSLVKKLPESANAIKPMKGLSDRNLERNRAQIWEAIQRGAAGDLPDLDHERVRGRATDDGYEARVDLALAFTKGVSLSNGIDPALIGNRAEISALVMEADGADPAAHRILRGWRGEFCGRDLLALLRGEGAVSVDPVKRFPVFRGGVAGG